MTRLRIDPEGFARWDELLALLRQSFAYMEGRIDPPSSLQALDAAALRAKAGREHLIVAEAPDGALLGCAYAECRAEAVYVGKLAVTEAARGQGLSRRLLEAADTVARRQGRAWLELQTRVELSDNHRTFAALGFDEVARTAHPGFDRPTSLTLRRAVAPAPGPALDIEPLREAHLPALAEVLRHPEVYRHLGEAVPSPEVFMLGLSRALQGPPPSAAGQRWLHWRVGRPGQARPLGRLEATVHGPVAEVAFLFDPAVWGQGLAHAGLEWMHRALAALPPDPAAPGPLTCWATTVPANTRCQALLERAGYERVTEGAHPALLSFDPGDLVYRGPRLDRPAA